MVLQEQASMQTMRLLLFSTLIFFVPSFLAFPINQDATRSSSPSPSASSPKTLDTSVSTSNHHPQSNTGPVVENGPMFFPPPPRVVLVPSYIENIVNYKPQIGDLLVTRLLPGVIQPKHREGKIDDRSFVVASVIDDGPKKRPDDDSDLPKEYECLLFDRDEPKAEGEKNNWERSRDLFSSKEVIYVMDDGVRKKYREGPEVHANVFISKTFFFGGRPGVSAYKLGGKANKTETARLLTLAKPAPNFFAAQADTLIYKSDGTDPPSYPKKPSFFREIVNRVTKSGKASSGFQGRT